MAPVLDNVSQIVMVNLIVNLTECRIIQETPMGTAVSRIIYIR